MVKSSARSCIRLRGVRHNNLKNFDLDLPINQLIVVTGLSGSGKSSLAFDTLFAEGQRRYIETFSPYARQFFDRMDKPKVDSIEGIPPAIAIEQRNAVKTTRSTVGTMTEICDYMKMLWPHVARLHCRHCGREVRKDSPQQIWESILKPEARKPKLETSSKFEVRSSGSEAKKSEEGSKGEVLVAFELALSEKLSLEESLALVSKQGYQRLLIEGEVVRLDEVLSNVAQHKKRLVSLSVIQDRVKIAPANRARFVEACEQAYHFGKGKLAIYLLGEGSSANGRGGPPHPAPLPKERETTKSAVRRFSNRLHCAECDIEYREPTPALFSFNHPVGACPKCRGFGRMISIDYDLAMPDRSKTLTEGVVKPWLTGHGLESQRDLMRACRHFEIPTDVPFYKLPKKWQEFVIQGDPDYGKDEEHHWPRAWYGVKGYFRWLESKAYKMHVRVLLSRYRAYTPCEDCGGKRFQPEALLYKVQSPKSKVQNQQEDGGAGGEGPQLAARAALPGEGLTLADFYQLPIRDACRFVEEVAQEYKAKKNDPLWMVLNEVRARLGYLNEVGLGYLTLDRPTRSLSGGETERVNLTTCLGTRLVNTLFVLDEPSVGLHARDTERLVRILQALRDAGNTVVVVEHEASVMRAANQIVDLGPGHGATGGEVVFQGSYEEILKAERSLTGEYLSGRKKIDARERRAVNGPEAERESASSARRVQLEEGRRFKYPSASASEAWVLNDAARGMAGRVDCSSVLRVSNATRNNLKDLSVEIPLKRFVCVTGVSGSGKTTLIREVLLPALTEKLRMEQAELKASERLDSQNDDASDGEGSESSSSSAIIEGSEHLDRVVLVDQSILGKTPRSNPAVYIGAFDDIREFFAQSELAEQRGLNASAFSFNSSQGQCERCRGAGFEKIEMQFLSDVFIRCPDCDGRRYRQHILEVKVRTAKFETRNSKLEIRSKEEKSFSIADLLDATVEEAVEFLAGFSESKPARRAAESLRLLEEVGLGYLKLGQPINTLSGGESQRLKLVRHLAESVARSNGMKAADEISRAAHYSANVVREEGPPKRSTLFLFDEPTTGLHFDDVRVLLKVFQRLVDAGHSVIVIEHNLDVIKSADWIIDLGPDAGDEGGQIVAEGTPEQIAACDKSYTGKALCGLVSSQNDRAQAGSRKERAALSR